MAGACRRAKASIDVATPFLSADVAAYLVRACDGGEATTRRFITALNVAAIQGGYLDPDGIDEFDAAGFEVRSLRNLHAKVLLTDDRWGLIGSGNLTVAGANGGNAELGILLSAPQTHAARQQHFDRWWTASEPIDLKYLRTLAQRRPSSNQRRRREGRGGLFQSDASVDLRASPHRGPAADIGSRFCTRLKSA
jgi:phosphatidylserine/phosphatidylglycerophosphate/cardiolipin synthase-like enzyme